MATRVQRSGTLRVWRELSAAVRFGRAGGRCECCGRPHAQTICHLGDGRWWDEESGYWRDGQGRRLSWRAVADAGRLSFSRVMLACTAADDARPSNDPTNLLALCRRCLMLRRASAYRQLRRLSRLRRRALGDLFFGPYPPNRLNADELQLWRDRLDRGRLIAISTAGAG